jgi:hypothetical protein
MNVLVLTCANRQAARGRQMAESEDERRSRQRAVRDQHLAEVEKSLRKASKMIRDSKREIQRSRQLMQDQRQRNARDDKKEDEGTE